MVLKFPIYLDYMSTTPVDPRVKEKMLSYLTLDQDFGNASSHHMYGLRAKEAVENSRIQVANLINADKNEIIWTSSATEANNLAIKGAVETYYRKGKHLITSTTEHPSVLNVFKYLEAKGFEVTYINPEKNGIIDPEKIKKAIKKDTILISVMYVNNEIGVIQDINTISEIVKSKGIIFHTDAVQAAGKILLDTKKIKVDLMSLSAHKIYGPKGIGVLYVSQNPKIRLEAQMHGGGHEFGLRSGTLATHQIAGAGEAFKIAKEKLTEETRKIKKLRDKFLSGIEALDNIKINGDLKHRIVHNLSISVYGVKKEEFLESLKNIAISTGSACKNVTESLVLKSIGVVSSVPTFRISFGRFTTEEEVDYALIYIKEKIKNQRKNTN